MPSPDNGTTTQNECEPSQPKERHILRVKGDVHAFYVRKGYTICPTCGEKL